MRITYADVARRAADWTLRLDCLADGRRLDTDAASFARLSERFFSLHNGEVETEPNEGDPIFTTVEGQFVLILVAKAEGDGEEQRAKDNLRRLHDAAERIASDAASQHADEVGLLGKFFGKVHDVAEELSVTGLRADPVYELFSALA